MAASADVSRLAPAARPRARLALAALAGGVPAAPPGLRLAMTALLGGGAVAVAASALIHLHLWLIGYRHVPLIGPAFLAQALSGLLLAGGLLAYRRLLTALAGAAYLGGSAGALLLSATVGFLGLHDGLAVPWAGWSLALELAGCLALLGVSAGMLRAGPARSGVR